jgi:methionine-rich copper-binding protein CopC
MMRYALTVILFLLNAAPALACPILDHAEPRVGSTVAAPPTEVKLFFTGEAKPATSSIQVTDAAGKDYVTGSLSHAGNTTSLAAKLSSLAPGKYKVTWSADCGCGENMPGSYKFTVK